MPIPSRYGIWPLGGQRPCAPGDHGPRPLDLWVGRHLEGWCERLAGEAGVPLTDEERTGVRRAAGLWTAGQHSMIMAGHPRPPLAVARPDWWGRMSAEEQARVLEEERRDALVHTGIEYGAPNGRGQIAWLIYSGPESDRVGSAREWARAQLAADIATALQAGADFVHEQHTQRAPSW